MENTSGIWPVGYRVLVKPDPIRETTAGGIYIAETVRDSRHQAQTTGVFVCAGEFAWKEYQSAWAKPGDRVIFARYGGLDLEGADGEKYRLLNDEQITGLAGPELDLTDVRTSHKRTAFGG